LTLVLSSQRVQDSTSSYQALSVAELACSASSCSLDCTGLHTLRHLDLLVQKVTVCACGQAYAALSALSVLILQGVFTFLRRNLSRGSGRRRAAMWDAPGDADGGLRKKIIAIQLDTSLTDAQKAQKRQALMAGKWLVAQKDADSSDEEEGPGAHSYRTPTHISSGVLRSRAELLTRVLGF